MKIDFYHYNVQETINWENIWKRLSDLGVDAGFVVEKPGKNTSQSITLDGYNRIIRYMKRHDYPHETEGRFKDADAVITTQTADWLGRYNCLKINTLYGSTLTRDCWGYSEKKLRGFDRILVHGEYSRQRVIASGISGHKIAVMGYPKYAAFYRGEVQRDAWIKKFHLNPRKQTVVYLPSWHKNSSIDTYADVIEILSRDYNVLIKPHHNNLEIENDRIEKLKSLKGVSVYLDPESSLPFYLVADLVLADTRSGAFAEGILTGCQLVGLHHRENRNADFVEPIIYHMAPICEEPSRLVRVVDELMGSDVDPYRTLKDFLKPYLFADYKGKDDAITAQTIIKWIEGRKRSRFDESINSDNPDLSDLKTKAGGIHDSPGRSTEIAQASGSNVLGCEDCEKNKASSGLETIIPPEIKNDKFYDTIQRLARQENIETVLEIGSSAGTGSTEAFAKGLRDNPNLPVLFCIEVSRKRFAELKNRYADDPKVQCYNVSSVGLNKFPSEDKIIQFYNSTHTSLNSYPLKHVLGWYQQDIEYIKTSGVPVDGIQKIKQDHELSHFGIVLIDGSEFSGEAELDEVYGAKIIMLDDINTYKNHNNYIRLSNDPNYFLIEENLQLRNGYAIFKHKNDDLPIHFFTIVLNGQPFISHHIEVFKQLPITWHWHIVEGVADLKHDTAWSLPLGGQITSELHHHGLSNDGTREYLDDIAQRFPDNVTVYRKPGGAFWDGKREMVNAPLANIQEDCLLWQIDADELWSLEQIRTMHKLFEQNPGRTAAYCHCHFFVGPGLVTITPEAYSHHNSYEWLRVWRFKPQMRWASHEPPQLVELRNGIWTDIATLKPFTHEETTEQGLVFTHYAYALESQLRFKERYYGYADAVNQWQRLQQVQNFPVRLKDYFSWVNDDAQVDRLARRVIGAQVEPIPWDFDTSHGSKPVKYTGQRPIVIDGVIFQLQAQRPLGISRVWQHLIPGLSKALSNHPIIILRRKGYPSRIEGIREYEVPIYCLGPDDVLDADDAMLADVCKKLNAAVFLSTYYTRAPGMRNIATVYDLIPEAMGFDLTQPEWNAKKRVFTTADSFVAISNSTRKDLLGFYEHILPQKVTVAYPGVSKKFYPAQRREINQFARLHHIYHPYFIVVGNRGGYKNCEAFFRAYANLKPRCDRQILAVGGEPQLLASEAQITRNSDVIFVSHLNDDELRIAYSGALALVYPSRYEGFGLPVLEALACGCPVITTRKASIPEVGGDAVIYIHADSPGDILKAMHTVIKADIRSRLADAGVRRAANFTWTRMASGVSKVIADEMGLDQKMRRLNQHGEGRFRKGDIAGALKTFKNVIDIGPNQAIGHINLGVAYCRQGQKDKAVEHYQQAIRLEPENLIALKNLADSYYVELGRIEAAMKLYVKILAINPRDVETLLIMGHICVALEKFEDAATFYNRILAIEPRHAEARQYLDMLDAPKQNNMATTGTAVSPKPPKKDRRRADSEDCLVSAIVSVYNSERFIRGCLEDLENQTIADQMEIIIINSASRQNEEAIIEDFRKKHANIKYIKTRRRETVYAAWNRGIKQASGKYITSANTDDRHRKDALEMMAKTLEQHPEISLVYADVLITETENQTFENCTPVGYFRWMDWHREDLLYKGCFMGPQPMWRRDVHKEYGYFDESFVTSGDYEFWLRISQTRTFLHLPQCLGLYLRSPGSIEHTNRDKQTEENNRIFKWYHQAHGSGTIIRRPLKDVFCATVIDENSPRPGPKRESPNDDIRVSIIIPTSRQLKYLKNCVASINAHTPERHEIIFVHNGGAKGTEKWLRRMVDQHSNYHRVQFKKHSNLARCYNTGIRASSGRYVLLLANDAIVSSGWLTGMLACFHHTEDAGIIGPMSNYADGPQKVPGVDFKSVDDVATYAASFRANNRYRRIPAIWLDGFCLLFSRELVDKIGVLDETFGTDGFVDKDYCLRAALAGHNNGIAGDVYLHRQPIRSHRPSKKHYNEKWTETDAASAAGKKYLALKAIEKGDHRYQSGHLEQAVELFLEGIGLSPDDRNLYYQLARVLLNAKHFQDAVDVLDEIPSDGNDHKKLELMGYCKEGLGQTEEARDSADRLLSMKPRSAAALNLKGLLAYGQGDIPAAEGYFERAIESDRGYGDPYTNLGALRWDKDPAQALDLFEKAFVLSPTIDDIIRNYHSALTALDQYRRAEQIFIQAAGLHPHNKNIAYQLIDVLLKQEKYTEAMGRIESAIVEFGVDDGILQAAQQVRDVLESSTVEAHKHKKNSVSLCMIVKNEEADLASCLGSVRPIVDEMIVVDTGSTDRTKDIARALGAKVFEYAWAENFSEARNYAISKASGDWTFHLDADEIISSLDYPAFKKIISQPGSSPAAYLFNTRNYTMDVNLMGWTANDGKYHREESGTGWTASEKVRLFRKDPRIYFEYPVHELVEPSLQRAGIPLKKSHVPIHHYGKLKDQSAAVKSDLYYEIGRKKLEELGDNPPALRELAIQAEILGKHEEALELWKRFLSFNPNDPIAYVNMGIVYCRMERFADVLEVSEKAMKFGPDVKEGYYNYALSKLHLGQAPEAAAVLEKLLAQVPAYPPAKFLLAAAYCCVGRKERGIELFDRLRKTEIGPGLSIRCHDLAKGFFSSQRPDYARMLLEAAMDSHNSNEDILALYGECLKMAERSDRTGTYP